MSDSPPRIAVTLPGGRQTEARLLAWVRGPDGAWRAEVTLTIPAAAVTRLPGEDYGAVPRRHDAPVGARFVVAADTRQVHGQPPGTRRPPELHLADCWTIAQDASWR